MASKAKIATNAAWAQDLLLARRCAARDPAAVRQLTGANNQRLFRAAWSILKDRSEAEEAVQTAYLKAFAAFDGFAGQSSLSTWLTRIVVNESLGRLRSAARKRARFEDIGVAVLDEYREKLMRGSQPARPDAAVAAKQLRAMIEQAIAGLPPAFRTVFILREIEGMSVEETGEALGVAAATVKTRLLRARRKLQQSLEPDVRSALEGAFPFAGADCEAMTERLLAAISAGK
jgi:RNA polymerase sigma-70 factor (ECF subfamily)